MKKSALLLLSFLTLPLVAQEKKDIVQNTTASEVTVFIKGAQVVRRTTVSFPAGKSTVRFTNLSPYIDAKSVQIKVDGQVMVLSVNHQQNYNDSVKHTAEMEAYAKQLESLEEKIKLEQATKETIAEELAFLQDNKKIAGNNGIELANLRATTAYYAERMATLKVKAIETDKKIKALTDEKDAITRKIAVIGGVKPEPTGEAVLEAECKMPVRVPVELSYYVSNAGWYPSYDVRAESISEPISLIYKANIMQNTKEEWKNIKLKASSANPNSGNVVTQLKPYYLNYSAQPPRYNRDDLSGEIRGRVVDSSGEALVGATVSIAGTTIGTIADIDGNFNLTRPANGGNLQVNFIGFLTQILPIANNFMTIVMEENNQTLDEVVVTGMGATKVSGSISFSKQSIGTPKVIKAKSIPLPVAKVENVTSVEFEIKTPYTIPSENKNTTVAMQEYALPAQYEYYCAPKADKDAFLLANIADWEQYNLLEGEANIFFENTFVGKTILDVRYMSDTLNISLGRDKSVTVRREKVKDYTTKKFLSSKAEVTRDWKITVKNNKSQPINMVLFDQVPVSTLEEIEVTPEQLSGGHMDESTGEVKWKFTLPAFASNELELMYKVKYPKDRNLTIE